MLLERLEMENFKSFRGRHEVIFGPRLNCITGPNGSGKSNILEAICFAFGESSCARLRVASMKELHSKQTKSSAQETTTRVTLQLRTRQNESMTLSATLCARTGHRAYKLNNRVTPIKLVKRRLRLQCGINVDITLWLIQQNFVHKMPNRTPVELAAYLCEAAGTKIFFEYREEAQAAMVSFKQSVQTVHHNIQRLSDVVQRDTSIIDAYRKHRENERQIEVLNRKQEDLNHRLLLSKQELGHAELAKLESSELEVASSLELTKSEFERLQREVDVLQSLIDDGKKFENAYEDAQLELVRIGAVQDETVSRLQRLRTLLQSNDAQQKELGHELSSSIETKAQVETSLCTTNARIASFQAIAQLVSTARRQNKSVRCIAQDLSQQIDKLRNEDAGHLAKQLDNKLTELRDQESRVKESHERAEQEVAEANECIREATTVLEQLRLKTRDWNEDRVEREMKRLQDELNDCDRGIRGLRARLPTLSVPLQGEGDFGLLMDHLAIDKELMSSKRHWIGALALLLNKSLANRICSDTHVAKRILAANENQHSFTIWPVKDLKHQPRRLDKCLQRISKTYGCENVIDPLQLIFVPQTTSPEVANYLSLCLRKAVGSWLLVSTDEIGREVLRQYGISSVSINLNMHSHGMLSGGYREEETTFHAFVRLPNEQARREKLEEKRITLDNVRSDLEAVSKRERAISRFVSARGRVQAEVEDIQRTLVDFQHQRAQLEQEKTALRDANIRLRVFEADMTAYSDAIQEHRKILDPIESVYCGQDLSTMHTDVHRLKHELTELEVSCVSLQSRLNQLEEDTHEIQAQITQLNDSTESLKLAASKYKTKELECAQGLQQFAEDTSKVKAVKASIRRVSEMITKMEANLEGIVHEKRMVKDSLCEGQRELDCAQQRNPISNMSLALTMKELNTEKREVEKALDACHLKHKAFQAEFASIAQPNEENVLTKQRQLSRFKDQDENLRTAIRTLEEGIRSTQKRSAEANRVAFAHVKRCLHDIFTQVVPTKSVELRPLGSSIEAGIRFDVTGKTSSEGRLTATKELSGGQLAMLGMAYVFALARFSASPLCVLDEIDAALDEHNQRVAAELVIKYFNHSQVICISHHEAFHARASQLIEVHKSESTSKITTRKARR